MAYYSILNDRIILDTEKISKNRWLRKIAGNVPFQKRRNDFPAVKIGRLGVDKEFRNQHVGTEVIDIIKADFANKDKAGCRFITVDAYNQPPVINFYKNNGFDCYSDSDESEKTRLMYFDLLPFVQNQTAA